MNSSRRTSCEIVELPLREAELEAAEWMKNHLSPGGPVRQLSAALYAHYAVKFAALHPLEMRAWMRQAFHYHRSEGVEHQELMDAQILNHPAYKRTKLPA